MNGPIYFHDSMTPAELQRAERLAAAAVARSRRAASQRAFVDAMVDVRRSVNRLETALAWLEGDAEAKGGADWSHVGTATNFTTRINDLLEGFPS